MSRVTACPHCQTRNRLPDSVSGRPRCAKCKADLPWIVDATSSDFDEAIGGHRPVLVDLWAPWCGPCRTIAPGIERAAAEMAGSLKVVKVNVDEAPDVSARFEVQGIPTLLILRDGRLVESQVGALPPDQLISWVRRTIEASASA